MPDPTPTPKELLDLVKKTAEAVEATNTHLTDAMTQFHALMDTVQSIEGRLGRLERRLEALRPTVWNCPNCHRKVQPNATRCPTCSREIKPVSHA